MQKKHKKLVSLERQLSVWFASLYFIMLFTAITFWILSIHDYQNMQNDYYEEMLESYVSKVDKNIQQTNTVIANMVLTNKSFISLGLENNELKKYLSTYQLFNDINLLLATQTSVDGIFVFYDDYKKQVYRVSHSLSYSDMRQLLKNNLYMIQNNLDDSKYVIQQVGKNYYYCFYYIRNGKAVLGISNIGFDLNDWKIDQVIDDTILISKEENIIYASEEELKTLQQGRNVIGKNIIYMKSSKRGEIQFAYAMQNNIQLYLNIQHFIVLLCLLLSTYPTYRIYCLLKRQILEPLAELTSTMTTLQNGDWEVRFTNNTRLEEIENVKKTLIVMIGEIKNLKIQKYEEQSRKQIAKLQYLQLQLNPHFYINCLKLIQARIQLGHTQDIEDFLIELAFHFRYLMKKGMELVTVAEEIKFVENFFSLQKELWAKDVNKYIYVDDNAVDKKVPMLAVQTFVENSIKYAQKDLKEKLFINIHIQYMEVGEGKFINIVVRDNGIGYPETVLPILNSEEADDQKVGIGITNLKKRITLLFEKNYNWYFYNQGGAVSEILLSCPEEYER